MISVSGVCRQLTKSKPFLSRIPLLCAVLLIGGMVSAADVFQNPEIIFPEAAAIAAGSLLTPQLAWRTDSLRTFVSIAVSAVLGLCTVLWVPGAVWLQMSAAYLLASVLYLLSRTGFAPMISAAVLPVLLQTESPVYPVAACVLTAAVLWMRRLLVRWGVRSDVKFEKLPAPDADSVLQMLVRWLIASAVIFAAIKSGFRYAAAPPLLVAFTEFWKPEAVSRRRPAAVILLVTLSALCAAGIRYLLCVYLSLAPGLAAALTVPAVYFLMKRLSLMLSPAAAAAVLAFLIPEAALGLFPVQVFCGISVFVGASYLYRGSAVRRRAALRKAV